MDIERGCLEILFKLIPYDSFIYPQPLHGDSLNNISKELFLVHAKEQFPYYSNNELENIYDLISPFIDSKKGNKDIFDYLYSISNTFLNCATREPTCKYEQLLRWRETSFVLGQDIFATSILAKEDMLKCYHRKFFSWRPVLRTDNDRLHTILEQGMAENHFHINGSSQNFILNWISIMNNVVTKSKENITLFKRLAKSPYENATTHTVKGIYDKVRLAAYYRCYLFASVLEDTSLLHKLDKLAINENTQIDVYANELQTIINICKHIYGYDFHNTHVLDYCITDSIGVYNDNHNRILSGERYFLYSCFKKIFNGTMHLDGKQKLFFWRYLTIKAEFRSEFILMNNAVGFDNFSQYQDRKDMFVNTDYLNLELLKLSIASTCADQNIRSLEGRIMCGNNIRKAKINLSNITKNTLKKDIDFFIVIHFPKKKNMNTMPKNLECRNGTLKIANRLFNMLEDDCKSYWKHNTVRIKGIDACSNEIGCRPEVFAQAYRFLLNEARVPETYKDNQEKFINNVNYINLKASYHAGEDFLDIVDGLRAIDEVLLFCGFQRGFRIGHALALGIDSKDYYKSKNHKVIMPKQDALDNVVWMMERSVELGLQMTPCLRDELLKYFAEWISDIYDSDKNADCLHQEISLCEYYNAWKLRGDNPEIYKLSGSAFLDYLKNVEIDIYKKHNINNVVDDAIRGKHRHRDIYFRYHYDEKVQERGSEIVTLTISQAYMEHVTKLQDMMIQLLVIKGIGVECNPSSNFLIGTFHQYKEHPILRFQPIKQENNFPGRLSASINTDDQGIFDTYLENEYAIMAYSLQKAYEKDKNALYDIDDVYDWIDRIRKLGIQQKF